MGTVWPIALGFCCSTGTECTLWTNVNIFSLKYIAPHPPENSYHNNQENTLRHSLMASDFRETHRVSRAHTDPDGHHTYFSSHLNKQPHEQHRPASAVLSQPLSSVYELFSACSLSSLPHYITLKHCSTPVCVKWHSEGVVEHACPLWAGMQVHSLGWSFL